MNCLLKVALWNASPYGQREIARTAIMCDKTEVNAIVHKFFDCFNMTAPSPWHNLFGVDIHTAPLWDFDDPNTLQLAEELDEDNPFNISDDDMNWVWYNVNEWRYSGLQETIY